MGNAEDALSMLTSFMLAKPELIFLDWNLPKMTGLEFLKELKKDYLLKDISIIIYTAGHIEKDIQLALHLGAINYAIKPSSFPKICDIIRFFHNNSRDLVQD
jgi:two-component system phosphate regulon response regulator PhoB